VTGTVPARVTLHVWGVPTAQVPGALARMALDRRPLRRLPGLTFGKLLGTGRGRSFLPADTDPRHWAVLACWDSPDGAERFERSDIVRSWDRLANERLRVTMRPLASRGRWSRQEPFGRPEPSRHLGPVAAITRARLVPRKALTFWRAVPPVSADLHRTSGLRLAVGIGEAPIGLQGTFSLWESAEHLTGFAHRRAAHVEAVRRTEVEGWYAEELFARLAVLDTAGMFDGRVP
jgi:hypothetical protein